MPTKAIDNKQSTTKVSRGAVLLGWQVQRPKYNIDPITKKKTNSGSTVTVRGSTILYYPTKLIDWFNIATYEPTATTGDVTLIKVDQSTKNFYDSITDAAAKTVNVREFERLGGNKQSRRTGRSVQVPLGDSKRTPKGNPRLVSFLFPNFFNLIMVSQALGQMMGNANANRKPAYFISESGVTYPVYTTANVNTDGLIPGATSGAWVTTTLVTASNIDNPDDIPSDTNVIGAAGDRDGTGVG